MYTSADIYIVYSCWLGLRATDDLLALKMKCCQRPKAEGNSSSEGPTDHLLPENTDNNCFVMPNFLELSSMMNGQAPDKMINYTTQKRNTFFFFLPLMNHFSIQNLIAIPYKNHWFLAYRSPFFFKPHSQYCQQKFLKTMHIFVTPMDVFSADLQTTVQSPRDTCSVYSMPSW